MASLSFPMASPWLPLASPWLSHDFPQLPISFLSASAGCAKHTVWPQRQRVKKRPGQSLTPMTSTKQHCSDSGGSGSGSARYCAAPPGLFEFTSKRDQVAATTASMLSEQQGGQTDTLGRRCCKISTCTSHQAKREAAEAVISKAGGDDATTSKARSTQCNDYQ